MEVASNYMSRPLWWPSQVVHSRVRVTECSVQTLITLMSRSQSTLTVCVYISDDWIISI